MHFGFISFILKILTLPFHNRSSLVRVSKCNSSLRFTSSDHCLRLSKYSNHWLYDRNLHPSSCVNIQLAGKYLFIMESLVNLSVLGEENYVLYKTKASFVNLPFFALQLLVRLFC